MPIKDLLVDVTNFKIIETNNHNNLIEFIKDSKEKGLSHLVIDNSENRPEFLKIVPNQYEFLINEEIKIQTDTEYEFKLYRIDYEKFFELNNKK